MKSDAPLDYALFQLSPKHTRCELFVSSEGSTEKLASGLLKPFVAHLQIAEEQVSSAAQSVKLEVGRRKNAETWFTKGTLERFVRFVSTPEVLELVNTFDAEMSQLEAARRIYSQGAGDQLSGRGGSGVKAADDATKKELLRAIDVRLVAVRQDLSTACSRAAAAGFNIDTVQELQMFADRFGAHRLNEACGKFISLSERWPEFINPWKSGSEDRALRSSYGSDMSIDDDPTSSPPHQEPAACQQPNAPPVTFPLRHTFSRESSAESDDGKKQNDNVPEKDRKDESTTPDETLSIQAGQPARRLSVQDRINLFESKKKENSGRKPVVVKPVELRRLSSDLSSSGAASEKALLRRWSGASDMSMDLSADKRDTESPSCTPTSAVVQDKKVLNLNSETIESSVSKPETRIIPSPSMVSDRRLNGVSFNSSEQFLVSSQSNSNLGSAESDGLKDKVRGKTQTSPISRADDQESSGENCKTSTGSKNQGMVGFGDHGKLKGCQSGEGFHGSLTQTGVKSQVSSSSQIRASVSKGSDQFEILNQREGYVSRDESIKQIRMKPTQKTAVDSRILVGGAGSRIREAFGSRYKGFEGNSSSAQQEVKSVGETAAAEKKESHMFEESPTSASDTEIRATGGTEVAGKKESCLSEKVSNSSIASFEDSGPPRMKFNRQGLTNEVSQKAWGQRDESGFSGNSRTQFSGKVKIEAQEGFDSFSTPPLEQAQRVRQSKGNQELNDELKMKANELEKLFAEHKLRVPGDQSNSVCKGRSGDTQHDTSSSLHYSDIAVQSDRYLSTEHTRFPKNSTKSGSASPMKTIDGQYCGDAINKKFSELYISECSRGKLYDRYMQKREAKLREEWSVNRAAKEARLKSMQDSLERSRSEMKAKISGSADRQDSVSSAHRRAERLGSYNSRSITKREQQHLDFENSEDGEEALDFPEQNLLHENRALDDTSFSDSVSGGAQGKKHLPNNRSLSSSTPRTSAAPIPKSATRISTIKSGKRRMQPENPLGQSVPNFSDLRKENAKPSSGSSKTTRSQVRDHARSKSISDESAIVREDKSRRSQSSRTSSANPSDFREIFPLDSDVVVLTPLKFDEKVLKNGGTKPFLKKSSRTSFVAQSSTARQKGCMESELINNEEENNDMETESGPDDFVSTVKDEGEEEFETSNAEDQKILCNGEARHGLESDKLVTSGTEHGDGILTFSLVDQALGAQLPTVVPRSFLPGDSVQDSVQDWPEESPVSWNSRTQHPFSYPHEMSDFDASVDSPVGSPASWNTHSLNQLDSDTARMRKKWGTAEKPMLGAHSSNNLSQKDMTRGFKRLLKFGRKNRASESLVDWISATTSEGDDDNEDGQDPANRSSEDLRKSRMGFHAHPSDDIFNESEFFHESVQPLQNSIPAPPTNFKPREDHMSGSSIKAPTSFFSLSSFRGKGTDSKAR